MAELASKHGQGGDGRRRRATAGDDEPRRRRVGLLGLPRRAAELPQAAGRRGQRARARHRLHHAGPLRPRLHRRGRPAEDAVHVARRVARGGQQLPVPGAHGLAAAPPRSCSPRTGSAPRRRSRSASPCRCARPDALLPEALELAGRIARMPISSLVTTKRVMLDAQLPPHPRRPGPRGGRVRHGHGRPGQPRGPHRVRREARARLRLRRRPPPGRLTRARPARRPTVSADPSRVVDRRGPIRSGGGC